MKNNIKTIANTINVTPNNITNIINVTPSVLKKIILKYR